jgi:hypothetical protein
MSRLPDSKSICEKYVLSLEDLVRVRKRANKILKILGEIGIGGNILSQIHIQKKKRHSQKGFYRRYPKTHYYSLEYIKLKSFKM